jgi:hypothetical protein
MIACEPELEHYGRHFTGFFRSDAGLSLEAM